MKTNDHITAEAYRAQRFTNEAALQEWLRVEADLHGWKYYHTHNSRGGSPGFPDTVLVQAPNECYAELKMPGKTPSYDQVLWLDELARVRYRIRHQYVCVWYPAYEAGILAYLADPATVEPPGLWRPKG